MCNLACEREAKYQMGIRAVAVVKKKQRWEHKYFIQFVLLLFPVFSGHTLTIRKRFCRPYSKEEIVKRAKSNLGEQGYNILLKNCEHFVTWCRYGKEISQQVNRFFPSSSLVILELIHETRSGHAEWNKSYQYERSTRQRCPASI